MDGKITRRDLVKTFGASALILGMGGSLNYFENDRIFLRPPGMLNEQDFLAKCVKCQKCLAVCHTQVIVPVSWKEGRKALGTPTLKFMQGYCDLCMDCVEVCPTGALLPIEPEAVKIGIAKINPELCVAWDWTGCIECYEACPYDAITLDAKKRPVVDEDKCNGCGLCENICPSSSLRGYDLNKKGKAIVVKPI